MKDQEFPLQTVENPIFVGSRHHVPGWLVTDGLLRNEVVVLPHIKEGATRTASFGRQHHGIGDSAEGNRVQGVWGMPFGPYD